MIDFILLVFALFGGLLVWVIWSAKRSMDYVFCNATIGAWEAKLLSEARLVEIAEAPSLTSVFNALEDTDYRTSLAEAAKTSETDPAAIERALMESLNRRYKELAKMVPEERRGTLQRLLGKADLLNLKAIISMIHEGIPKEQGLQGLMPSPTMSNERLEMLASAEDLSRLLEFLKGSEYFAVVSASLEDYQKKGLISLLSALDKHYYTSRRQIKHCRQHNPQGCTDNAKANSAKKSLFKREIQLQSAEPRHYQQCHYKNRANNFDR